MNSSNYEELNHIMKPRLLVVVCWFVLFFFWQVLLKSCKLPAFWVLSIFLLHAPLNITSPHCNNNIRNIHEFMKYCRRYLPILISSSVSASPIHSNWKSCKDCENFCTAMDKSKIQEKEKETRKPVLFHHHFFEAILHSSCSQTFLAGNTSLHSNFF